MRIQGAAHAHGVNARKVLTCGKNGGKVTAPGRNLGGGTIEHGRGRSWFVERKASPEGFRLVVSPQVRVACRGGECTGGAVPRADRRDFFASTTSLVGRGTPTGPCSLSAFSLMRRGRAR